ncbi:hypothetical protein BCAR13_60215 [Paraburkholderia caribensis]|nr:hypothetical protein BCAR13_60215 [Paraburkholderia caribensis]
MVMGEFLQDGRRRLSGSGLEEINLTRWFQKSHATLLRDGRALSGGVKNLALLVLLHVPSHVGRQSNRDWRHSFATG